MYYRYPICVVAALLLICTTASSLHGQCETLRLPGTPVQTDAEFGWSVAIANDTSVLAIGAPLEDVACEAGTCLGAGAVYVQRAVGNSWSVEARLTAPEPLESGRFGIALAMDATGRLLLVGSIDVQITGRVHVFENEDGVWVERTVLTADKPAIDDSFGASIALTADGRYAAIAAPEGDQDNPPNGAVHVFENDGESWKHIARLTASDAGGFLPDSFGLPLTFSDDGDLLAVSSFRGSHGHHYGGAVYLFEREGETWIERTKLLPSQGSQNDYFSTSLDISGDGNMIIVGATLIDVGCPPDDPHCDFGAAFVFVREGETWLEADILTPADPGDKYFGRSVAFTNDDETLVIGAWGDSEAAEQAGAVYVFEGEGSVFAEQRKLVATDAQAFGLFGQALAASEDRIVVGGSSSAFNNGWPYPDAAYVIDPRGADCNDNIRCDAAEDVIARVSDKLSPIGAAASQGVMFTDLPSAQSDVTLSLSSAADLGDPDEYIDVLLNGVLVGSIFTDNGTDCDVAEAQLIVPGETLNTLLTNGEVFVKLLPSDAVDAKACDGQSHITVYLEYESTADGNGNDVLDECEQPGDLTGDGVVDGADLLVLLGMWGACDDCNACAADLDNDCTVGASDLIILLGQWGR